MDRVQILLLGSLLGLPLVLFFYDLLSVFTPWPPPPPHKHPHHHHHSHHHQPPPVPKETLDFPTQKPSAFGAIGVGSTIKISFCTSCSYKGNAVTITKMLESEFPGIEERFSSSQKRPSPDHPRMPMYQKNMGIISKHVNLSCGVYAAKDSPLHIPLKISSVVPSTVPDLIHKSCPLFKPRS